LTFGFGLPFLLPCSLPWFSFLLLAFFTSQSHLHPLRNGKKTQSFSNLHCIKTFFCLQSAICIRLQHEIGKLQLMNLDGQNQRGSTLCILCVNVGIKLQQ